MSRKNKVLTFFFVVGCVAAMGAAAVAVMASTGAFGDKGDVPAGVTIDGVDVGGMTKEQAQAAIRNHIADIQNRRVRIIINDEVADTTLSELGFFYDGNDHVEEAIEAGGDDFFSRAFSTNSHGRDADYKLAYGVDEAAVRDFVEEKCAVYDVKAKNSRLKFRNGKFIATKDRVGQKLNVEDTVEKIMKAVNGSTGADPLEIEAQVDVKLPKYAREDVSKCKDLLGSYSTSYASSNEARAGNVWTAANYIDGTTLYPGRTFSTVRTIKDRTEANGYKTAPEYSSGRVVDGVGGGVCQVSTTLYNAVLNAELEVVERSPHSMVVAYVDVSRDAAISGDYKDFKFKNNTDAPVYIAASASGGVLTFKIYGHETRAANRSIEFESEILDTIQPGGDVITEDKSLPASYRAVTQEAHVGYVAKLWKKVYIDGVQTEKTEVNSSRYSAEPQYVTVGNQGESVDASGETEAPAASEKPDAGKKSAASEKPAADKKPAAAGPKHTPKPKRTPKPRATAAPTQAPAPEIEESAAPNPDEDSLSE